MKTSNFLNKSCCAIQALLLAGLILPASSLAAVSGTTSSDFSGIPTASSPSAPPLVMLVMSVDHQLTHKAYTDYSDLDGDGRLNTGYTDTFDYYGYFDSNRCYSHDDFRFNPEEATAGINNHDCSTTNHWSGNFLNWATMTRIDIVRRVLYGGLRSTDDTDTTVLKRTYIPQDVHAFAKVFAPGTTTEMMRFTPYDNKTSITLCNVSTSIKSDPYVRIAEGPYPRWATSETVQCQWDDGASTPHNGTALPVYVAVCVSASTKESNCKLYPNGGYKPTGLLQHYGEDGTLHFGLMSGSYDRNIEGGVLRKNITALAGNSDPADDEIDTATGVFINKDDSSEGIIKTLNLLRIATYNYDYSTYWDCQGRTSTFIFKLHSGNHKCADWGNPLSEIYMEALRYFSGETSPTSNFNGDDTAHIPGLNDASWRDPMSADKWCANCAIVTISTGLNSFDKDNLSTSGITGLTSINDATDAVGDIEMGGSFAGMYLHGGDTNSNHRCTGKKADNLSDITGICPEVPQLEGGFHIAGLAHHAHTHDLRTGAGYPEMQKVDTYAVALAESLPSLTIKVGGGGKEITFLPYCESTQGRPDGSHPWQACSMTGITVESQHHDSNGNLVAGSLLISWDDSLFGNDYDLDAMERIEFCVEGYCDLVGSSATNRKSLLWADTSYRGRGESKLVSGGIRINTRLVHAHAKKSLQLGYTITGTTRDATYLPVVADNSLISPDFSAWDMDDENPDSEPQIRYKGIDEHRFIADFLASSATTAKLLKNPLYYAAKYGSYTDLDGSGDPTYNGSTSDNREWDSEDTDGNPVPDGIPDNFFQIRDPSRLEIQLAKIFRKIVSRVSSGTAAAVVSNNTSGEGALYQALYYPKYEDSNRSISWAGLVQGIFIDSKSNLREDANNNGVLDDCSTDPAIDIYQDTSAIPYTTRIKRYNSTDCEIVTESDKALDSALTLTQFSIHPITNLRPIWNARDELGKLTNSEVVSQRPYTNSAAGGRHILTSTDGTSLINFDTATFKPANYTYLDVADEATADNVIDYVRGKDDIPGYRVRSVDFNPSTSGDEVWRLGDIIHSSPVVIGTPNEGYGITHDDTSYLRFKTKYKNRRNVIIVGGNDGMIHAFNGGFWDASLKAFKTSNSGETAHPLGSELWGYVPKALLPHLKWLPEIGYPHVYYMDGRPIVFDANIFTADTDHPGGWGTVMVMGMRFGGGDITVDVNNTPGTTSDDEVFRSSYVVLDVTNPEVAPMLIAEISHANLGYTTGVPSVIKKRSPGGDLDWTTSGDNLNIWELVFGSGPTSHRTGTSTQSARLFRYDLKKKAFVPKSGPVDLDENDSFVGNPTSTDWDSDFIDDVVYFGIVGGTEAQPSGKLRRMKVSNGELYTLLSSSQPFISKPMTKLDSIGKKWIVAGTGRFFVTADSDNVETTSQQSMYGIKEPVNNSGDLAYTAVLAADLVDTTDVQIFTDGSILPANYQIGGADIDTYDQLLAAISSKSGWKTDFPTTSIQSRTHEISPTR